MKYVHTKDLKAGMIITKNIYDENGTKLLGCNKTLTEIESDITGWLMSVRNDISVSWGGPCATFDYAYIAGTPSTSTQLLSIKLQDDQGMRYLIACPNIPEMKPYVTIPDNFPPLDGGLEAVKSYLTSNGLEYKESERGISYYIPDDECPNGYIKAVLYFDERDGEICIQAILQ